MLAVVDKRHIGLVHGAGILLEKLGREAAEGMQFHTGHKPASGVLLLHGGNGGAELGRGVGEVLIHGTAGSRLHQFQPLAGAVERADGLVELGIGDS